MGTPEFSVPVLEAIISAGHEVVAVVTAPDKPSGRGQSLSESAVKKAAIENGLRILQPEKLKDADFISEITNLQPAVAVVVAFRMLPEAVWRIPKNGTLNLHASLLPDYRGAAPINWAIINGETKTGLTTFLIDKEIDTGRILLQKEIPIPDNCNAGDLHDYMMICGGDLIVQTLAGIEAGNINPKEQIAEKNIHSAPKIFRETCKIDWDKSAGEIHNLVRGLAPYPAAFTELDGKTLKIFRGKGRKTQHPGEKGMPVSNGKNYLAFPCADGLFEVLEIQLEGKKRMSTEEFLRGYQLKKYVKVL